jgi:hypothetical protein
MLSHLLRWNLSVELAIKMEVRIGEIADIHASQ